jgi:acetyl-CoA carboxylase biotin carboxyl carrier protein
VYTNAPTPTQQQVVASAQQPTNSEASASQAATSEANDSSATKGQTIKSPIVGTYYGSPSPDEPAYVNVGDRVEIGQTLCIIEAMKIMNEIESDKAGVVKEILVSNAQPVEFDQPLFIIG